MTEQVAESSSIELTSLSRSFSRRQMATMNSSIDSSFVSSMSTTSSSVIKPKSTTSTNPNCPHCGMYYCQIDFIYSWLSRYPNPEDQQNVLDKRVQELISMRLPLSPPKNLCEQRLLTWRDAMKTRQRNERLRLAASAISHSSGSGSFPPRSPSNSRLQQQPFNRNTPSRQSSSGYDVYLLSQALAFPPDEPLLSSDIYARLATCQPTQTFQTQNHAGLYQLCSNGRYIIADDWCRTYKGHCLARPKRCLTIYNQYEEQCLLMLPEFDTITQLDAVQSMTWHEPLQVFIFITYHRVYQCEPERGTINRVSEYDVPSSRHSLAHVACDQQSSVFLAYEYPAVCLDLWHISSMASWSLLRRWTPRELFPPPRYNDEDDDDDDEEEEQQQRQRINPEKFENESGVCGIASMRYADGTLHFLARHERHWCLHLFSVLLTDQSQQLIPKRRIDIDLAHLRFAGENFQMEVLPGEQGWLFAIRRAYLMHLAYNGKDAQKLSFGTSKRCANSIFNVCVMDERGKRRENSKHLVVRDTNTIRFYKL